MTSRLSCAGTSAKPLSAFSWAGHADVPVPRALVVSETGRVHAALGDEHPANWRLGVADGLLADGLGNDVPEGVAYFAEGEAERGAPAAGRALDDAARIDSALVVSRLNMLMHAARPYQTTAVNDVRNLAKDLAACPTTVAAETIEHMAKHRRPGPPNQPSRARPRVDADNRPAPHLHSAALQLHSYPVAQMIRPFVRPAMRFA
ncbi:hypothetical protein [Streptomyces sp. NBC_01207]|uniref:hypothetical protein n=1 Tax=Streptomyces sp. NBC_01207 TaxID=2903772 RepID=UPI002E112720|nr:hypothetical protein OG457_44675 [Streptomyces sp. NBC_01207]